LNPLLIHNIRVFDGSLHPTGWALLTEQGATFGSGATWESNVTGVEVLDGQGQVLLPGLLDTHCHGAMGQSANDGLAGMLATLDFNKLNGVAKSLLSLVTASQEQLLALCEEAKQLSTDERFCGIHLEGPFLAKAKKGAHDESHLALPDTKVLEALAATGVVKSITIAPELFSKSQLDLLENSGIRLCLGHTDIDYDGATEFFENHPGSVMTHAFNAMEPIHHRAPGPIPAAIEQGGFIELIVDGVHVHESVASLIPKEQLILVTDAMSATGMPDGQYQLGSLSIDVKDSVARTKEGNLAGSTLRLAQAVKNYAEFTGDEVAALKGATFNPARAYGIEMPNLSLGNYLLLDL